jgi:5-hydroxyisourate hydrolase
MMITTQVLDTALGAPAARIGVELDFFITGHGWREVGRGVTDDEGRVRDFGEPHAAGIYRLMFDVASHSAEAFFPSIAVTFEISEPKDHYHVRLLLSPFGYTVYRG